MSLSEIGSKVAGRVGTFFGVSKNGLSNIEQWKQKVEKRVQNEEFGLSMRHSFPSKKTRNDNKFVADAKKVLSQIEAVQKHEDGSRDFKQTSKQTERQKIDKSKVKAKLEKGSVEDYSKPGLSRQTESQETKRHQNKVQAKLERHSDEDFFKQGSSRQTENLETSEHLLQIQAMSTKQDKTTPKLTLTTKKEAEDISAAASEHVDFTIKLEDEDSVSTEDVRSKPMLCVINDTYKDEDVEADNDVDYKGSTEFISKIHASISNHDPSTITLDYSKQAKHHKSEPEIIFFDGSLNVKPTLKKQLSLPTDTGFQKGENPQKSIHSSKENNIDRSKPVKGILKNNLEMQNQSPGVHSDSNVRYSDNEAKDGLRGSSTVKDDENCQDTKKSKEEVLTTEDLVYGKDALVHYNFYVQIEKKMKRRCLVHDLAEKMSEYDWKLQAIDDLIEMARDYYLNPKSSNALKWKDLKKKVKRSSSRKLGRTEVRRKLESLPEYRPFFTWFIILAQLVSVAVTCGLGGLTYVGLEPRLTLEKDIKTMIGMETIHKWTAPNIWLGPSDKYLISVGALFAPCMRKDIEIQLMYSTQNLSDHLPLGCCEIKNRNIAGTTTQIECSHLSEGIAVWQADSTCANRPIGQNSVRHELKPCCVGLRGQCKLLSHKHCTFLDGSFHQFGAEHCSQVNCLSGVCGQLTPAADQPWIPASPYQWWRLPLSLLYHHGIIHVAIVAIVQWLLLTQIERTAGWLRMLIIYLLSGMGALLISAVFTPYQSHVGSVGAVFGMVGVVLVELIQFWSLVQAPLKELAKILSAIVLFLFCGTLPYLDLFGMLGGFIIGVLSGIVVLPYITFGKWQTRARVILIVVGSSLLIIMISALLHLFIKVQSVSKCSLCKTLNCISYTENMCKTSLWQQF